MSPLVNSVLGLSFLGVGTAATFLMYHLWGYPYDKERLHSTAPRGLVLTHRLLGVAYLALYVYFLVQMVPRLWNYQIEFPARTVAHFVFAMSIGVILIIKLAIVRFFRHMEAKLVPFLGTSLLVCTALLVGLSVPFALRERFLQTAALSAHALDAENIARVRELLLQAGFAEDGELDALVSQDGLRQGQAVLTQKCVICHDLRTVLIRPRTPDNWRTTVERMAERSTLFEPISTEEQSRVTAYLVAISPQLQQSTSEQRTQAERAVEMQDAVVQALMLVEQVRANFDADHGQRLFEAKCSQCHELKQVDEAPPRTEGAVHELVSRMVDEGLTCSAEELATIICFLQSQYVR